MLQESTRSYTKGYIHERYKWTYYLGCI